MELNAFNILYLFKLNKRELNTGSEACINKIWVILYFSVMTSVVAFTDLSKLSIRHYMTEQDFR
jgi:hypothetical protein